MTVRLKEGVLSQWNEREAREVLLRLIDGYLSDGVDLGPTFMRYREVYLDECPLDFPGDEDQFFANVYERSVELCEAFEDGDYLDSAAESLFRSWLLEGIVTMEDVVEEVIGDIDDEDEPASGRLRRQADGSWLVTGDFGLNDLNEALNLDLPTDLTATIGGFVMARLGRVPAVGDTVSFRGGQATVQVMDGRRVERVLLKIES